MPLDPCMPLFEDRLSPMAGPSRTELQPIVASLVLRPRIAARVSSATQRCTVCHPMLGITVEHRQRADRARKDESANRKWLDSRAPARAGRDNPCTPACSILARSRWRERRRTILPSDTPPRTSLHPRPSPPRLCILSADIGSRPPSILRTKNGLPCPPSWRARRTPPPMMGIAETAIISCRRSRGGRATSAFV